MKIAESAVQTESSYSYSKYESNFVKVTNQLISNGKQSAVAEPFEMELSKAKTPEGDTLELTDDAKKMLEETQQRLAEKFQKQMTAAAKKSEKAAQGIETPEQMKVRLLNMMFQSLDNKWGRRLQFYKVDLGNIYNRAPKNAAAPISADESEERDSVQGATPNAGIFSAKFTQTTEVEHVLFESEQVRYSAGGTVRTESGEQIDFGVSLNMNRTVSEKLNFKSIEEKQFYDPLVINYSGDISKLTDEKFDFDIDLDGKADKISFAGKGSGFLALDKNDDGVINDGGELFGPQSGNGFRELRQYDGDGNGWLDENDDVYSKLRVWSKDAEGNDQLFTLKELDIGAVYLNETSTKFDLGEGYMQSTSFFLKDRGGAGFISHIDLKV